MSEPLNGALGSFTGLPIVETANLPADALIYSAGGPRGNLPGIYDVLLPRRLWLGARAVPNLATARLAALLDLAEIAAAARKRLFGASA